MDDPLGPPSDALNTFHDFACSFRSGFSLLPSASLTLPTIISKSAVLSALTKLSIAPASELKTYIDCAADACAAGGAGGCCAYTGVADSMPTTVPRAIHPGRPPTTGAAIRSIAASFAKGCYSSVLGA